MKLDTLTGYLDHWADSCGDKLWLRDLHERGSEDYTWAGARAEVNAVAAALESRFGSGHNMLLLSRNRPHWFFADLATIRSGNVTVGLFTTYTPDTVEYIAGFTGAQVIFVGESANWEAVRPVLPADIVIVALPGVAVEAPHLTWEDLLAEGRGRVPAYVCEPSDVVSLVFTSGTTGLPKGVIQTHQSNLVPIERTYDFLQLGPQPRYFSYLPLSHLAERQIVEFSSLCKCGEVNFMESPATLLRDLPRTRPQIFFGAPRVWEQLRQAVIASFGGDEAFRQALAEDAAGVGARVVASLGLDAVEFCLTSSAPTPPALIDWWDAVGLTLVDGFGQTEAMGLVLSREDSRRQGSVGKPIDGVEYRITDEGELVVRAEGFTPGYYRQPEKTAELLRDGWLHTGDRARVDEDGFIYITGRMKDYFKTLQGKYVAPGPIEARFSDNEFVEQLCLIGRGFSRTVMVTVLTDAGNGASREVVEASLRDTSRAINEGVDSHARIGAVVICSEPWTVDNGVLTPTLKCRRGKIDDLYGEPGAALARTAAERGELLVHWL